MRSYKINSNRAAENSRVQERAANFHYYYFISFMALIFIVLISLSAIVKAGTWSQFTTKIPAKNGLSSPILLTDGSVILSDQGYTGSNALWKLSPDKFGSYINGKFTKIAPYPDYLGQAFSPYAAATAVLPDGRLIVAGGESNAANGYLFTEANFVGIYDPVADSWSTIDPPSFCSMNPNIIGLFNIPGFEGIPISSVPNVPPLIGDSSSVILPDGTFMLGCSWSDASALLNLNTLTWTQTGAGKLGTNHEEGWTLLPDGTVLAVDLYVGIKAPPLQRQVGSEIFNPKTGSWSKTANTVEPLSNPIYVGDCAGCSGDYPYPDHEIGSTCLRPDGTVVAFGGATTGANGIYNTLTKKWSKGPAFPVIGGMQLSGPDTPAALLPNGNILVAAAPYDNQFGLAAPLSYFELTSNNTLVLQPSVPDPSQLFPLLLTLPTGQVLMVTGSTNDQTETLIYTPSDTGFNPKWAPVISSAPSIVKPGNSYVISGKQFNGMSQGCVYGDDYQNATNFPLVRITNISTGHVFYSRTHDHSSMGVTTGNLTVSTHFDVPVNQETGASILEVVANGIPSKPVTIQVRSK